MHARLLRLTTIIALAVAPAALLPTLRAEDAPPVTSPAKDSPSAIQTRLDRLSKHLSLTAGQRQTITPILQSGARELRAVREDTSLVRREKLVKARSILKETSRQVRGLLTPEQQPKYDHLVAKAKKHLRERIREQRHASSARANS